MRGLWKAVSQQRGDDDLDEKYRDRDRDRGDRDRDRDRDRGRGRAYSSDDRDRDRDRNRDRDRPRRRERDDSGDEEEGRGRYRTDRDRDRDRDRDWDRKERDERDLDLDEDDDRGRDRRRDRRGRRDDDDYVDDPDEVDGKRQAERQRRKEVRRLQRQAQEAEYVAKQAADGKSPKLAPLPVNPDEERAKRTMHLRMDQTETHKAYRLYGQFPYSHEIWLVIWGITKIWIFIIFFIAAIFISGTNYNKADCKPSTNADFCLVSTLDHLCLDTSEIICGQYACQSPSSLQYDNGVPGSPLSSPVPASRYSGPTLSGNAVLTGYGCYVSNIPPTRRASVEFSSTNTFLPYDPNTGTGAEIICLAPTPEYRNIYDRKQNITTRTLVPDFQSMCDDTTNCPNANLTLMTRSYVPIAVCLMFLVVKTIISIGLCVFASNHPSEFDSISRPEKWLLLCTRSGFFLTQFFWLCILISYFYIVFNYSQYHSRCTTTLVAGNIPLVLFPHTRTYLIACGVMILVVTVVGTFIRQNLPMRGEMYVPSNDDELIFPCGLDCKLCRDRPQPKCCPGFFANWEECGYGTFCARKCAWTCGACFSITIQPFGVLLERCWKKRHFIGP